MNEQVTEEVGEREDSTKVQYPDVRHDAPGRDEVEESPESDDKSGPTEGTDEPVEDEEKSQEGSEVQESVEEAERRTGIRDAAFGKDVIEKAAREAEENPDAETHDYPSYFVEEDDRYKLNVDILFDPSTGRVASITRAGLGVDFSKYSYLTHKEEWFEFSIPNYEELASYRQRSMVYRSQAGVMLVDVIQQRNFIIVWHLKDWSLVGREGEKVELGFSPEGCLDDESIKKVYGIFPTMLDVVLTMFEKDVLLA